ncbi:aldo/keto reductase [Terrimonas sp. NA20]|uniref:Aldo/keto reductase n=1 Tax=Terrimonas ginsenosidimutans TaxID=2908004 RepID=A0ABS9KWC2_9BACT|nr:aldo/keto reductase [Terrimonas ginsenosidimutans]MCG2616605.1 aldo/keto reductase [Terrimonas ginsenosidimutans]
MTYHQLGRSTLHPSSIGFGCMSLKPGNPGNGNILLRAVDLGINFFDTADLYDKGENEILLGKAVKAKRKEILLATKVGNQWRADGSGWDWNARKAYILSAAEKSLQRLQTDYIDLYQLHGGMITDNIPETIEAFEELKQAGKIRAYGISSIRPNVIREYTKHSSIDSVMMQYSLLDRRPEEECIPLLQQNNISVLSRGGLAQGILVDKPAKDYLGLSAAEAQNAANAINQLSSAERTAAQTALQFVLSQIPIAIAGIRTMEQLQEIAATTNTSPLTEQEIERLKASVPGIKYSDHR